MKTFKPIKRYFSPTRWYKVHNSTPMHKIMVHIQNDCEYMDEKVCLEIRLPSIPRIGETLYLGRKLLDVLQNMAKLDLDIASAYLPQWFHWFPWPDDRGPKIIYSELEGEDLKPENLRDLDFYGANHVHTIMYDANSDIVHIELTNVDYEFEE